MTWQAGRVATKDPQELRGHITGIGGVFFRAQHREQLSAWYHDVLGLPITDAATAQMGTTVWAAFDEATGTSGPAVRTSW